MSDSSKYKNKGDKFPWKKLLYFASILVALVGSFILLIVTFMIHDALDKTQSTVLSNVDAVIQDLVSLETALITLESEVSTVNQSLDDLYSAFVPLSDGMNKTGNTLISLADSLSLIPTIGPTIPTASLRETSLSLKDSANKLSETASGLVDHKQGVADIADAIGNIKNDLHTQRENLQQTKKSIADIFGLIKLANILFFVVVLCMFGTFLMNSVAGLI
ncbi:Uncharacterised protein [Candidatus Bilamarchaeum dharawalense]|uniref:Uncharacterized protein n=1 Tax=Candidatus Bilamarchaeum dharawalense TaxID=2885759 RepID=A0A5E4LNX9_9ARCH|nr:Uncharacterised protein [Candidatus Bilamarchaeum dharawalense]